MSAYRDAVTGAVSGDDVGSIFSKLGKAAKGVGKGIRKGVTFVAKHPLTLVPVAGVTHLAGKAVVRAAKRKKRKGGSATARPSNVPSGGGGASPGSSEDSENADDASPADGADENEEQTTDGDEQSDDSESDAPDGESSGAMDEYIGLDEIAGEEIGSEEYVGAEAAAGPRMGVDPNRVRIKPKKWDKARRQPLGFTSGAIATTASATVSLVVQTLFRGRKLVVGPAIASFFTVDNLFVGTQSQFGVIASQSAEAFLPTTTGEDNLTMDPASPGMTISIAVTNIDTITHTFRGTIFGNSVQ